MVITPNKEVKNKDVSEESYSDTLRVTIWYKPRKKAAINGNKDFGSKIDNPGRIIIKTPKNPANIAIHILDDTFSFNIIDDKATTITGVSEPILCASAKDK